MYVDEFHHFVTPSMATILSGARKYQLGLVLAHQDLRQLQRNEEVASSVLSNPCVRVCFHVGDQDARWLAEGFSSFGAKDLQQLGRGEAICRIERSDNDFNLRTPPAPEVPDGHGGKALSAVREQSRRLYARPASEVEEELAKLRTPVPGKADPFSKRTGKKTSPPEEAAPPEEKQPGPPAPPPPVPQKPEDPPAPVPEPTQEEPKPPEVESKPVPDPPTKPPSPPTGEVEKAESIKNRIIQTAGGFGFSYETEKSVLDGDGRIDVVLTRGELVLACEISATTSAEHEIGNIQKCLRAGYKRIVHICNHAGRREKMRELLSGLVSPAEFDLVRFQSTKEFLQFLGDLATAAIGNQASDSGGKTAFSITGDPTSSDVGEKLKDLLAQLAEKLKKKKGLQ
jgi:hypothetical protein